MRTDKHGNMVRNPFPDRNQLISNDSLDILIKGVIKEKPKLTDTLEMLFKLKILSINKSDNKFLIDDIKIGDIIELDFKLDDIIEELTPMSPE